ncbi:Asp/Glu/hydantoin racemase [Pseudooceanicola sediminis]|uniref:Asp/Glu/hydantoin racemase n=1 Tax=Pseudooceanicola sediminis TaxID=2211117 RepID=A0A399J2E8_9RHOB|nr:aspartate/glutamate racemase family protein [Pseudooceanicola sediminis]KAA2317224.1 Asp/Glu/hydantoin racemase [Puniceibacterium sp. HSS470]RII39578.1 Asp/Glu/hydantoin racemase [Pseudooceanicola sediminis]|tara:strand:+ start:28560 stop:29201 length:642 start_codon:yes stop_codon:yes gene_type:complete
MKTILIINPNSSTEVTQGIAQAVAPLAPAGVRFAVEDLPDGPATISSEEDVARAGLGFAARVGQGGADAYVSACFSDPGLDLARAAQARPVIGIQEAGILTALGRADLFGIIALAPGPMVRHRRKIRLMGVESRFAGELALPGVSAAASGRDAEVFAMCVDLGRQLRALGAGAVVLGCAGMAPIRARLEAEIGVAVIDPVVAAAAMAMGAVTG